MTGLRFPSCAALAAVAALLACAATVDGATARERKPGFFQQLQLPWQSDRKPARKTKRPKTQKKRSTRPKPAERRDAKPAQRRDVKPAAPAAAAVDPRDVELPAQKDPPTLAPIGRTPRLRDEWAALALQVPAPDAPPLLPAEGPAPAPASVLALLTPRPAPQELPPLLAPEPLPLNEEAQPAPGTVPLPPRRDPPQAEAEPPAPGATPYPPLPPVASQDAPPPLPPEKEPEGGGAVAMLPHAPLPPLRPEEVKPEGPSAPDLPLPELAREDDPDCKALDDEGVAEVKPLPAIEGPGVCGSRAPVALSGVRARDGALIEIRPAATLRCSMARAFAAYVRDELAPAAEGAGDPLVKVTLAGSFQCRGRNGATSGKMSEHGRANAIDVSGLGLKNGGDHGIFDEAMPETLAAAAKKAACARFDTVLGPGSDGHHETHLHLDLQPRRSKSKLCQWDEPKTAEASDEESDRDGKTEDGGRSGKAATPEPDDERERRGKADADKDAGPKRASAKKDPPPKKASAAGAPERPGGEDR